MYVNYGDRNFFERGRLVDSEHSDTLFPVIVCNPYSDEEDLYQFAECEVNIRDTWIDRKGVMEFIGMTEESFDAIQFAIGCIDFYGVENFGGDSYGGDTNRMTKTQICDILHNRMISSDGLDIVW